MRIYKVHCSSCPFDFVIITNSGDNKSLVGSTIFARVGHHFFGLYHLMA